MQYLMYFCIKSNIWTQVEVGRLQKYLTPSPSPVVYFTDHSKAVVLVLVLLIVALWFILRGDLF